MLSTEIFRIDRVHVVIMTPAISEARLSCLMNTLQSVKALRCSVQTTSFVTSVV